MPETPRTRPGIGPGSQTTAPDVNPRDPHPRPELSHHPWPVLSAIAAGGAVGGLARFGLEQALPTGPGGFPWTTFGVNVSGCLLVGCLMVLAADVWRHRRLVRPFLGLGVLGGFTTFSVHVLDVYRLVAGGSPGTAVGYLVATVLAALAAVAVGAATTRWVVSRARERGSGR